VAKAEEEAEKIAREKFERESLWEMNGHKNMLNIQMKY
jgi:hypothetical protein